MEIGQRIRDMRKRRKLTQRELATRAGLYSTTISELERGIAVPKLPTLQAIANALDVDVSMLINEQQY